ncbi:MAG: ABC transporter substrate-binding protein [Burkholderiales bacterium]|nr:ABC transporter substrate-binding protein [Burkholderiales bacterium]
MENSNDPKADRRSFLQYALAGGVSAGLANLTIMRSAFAQAPSGPIVIGHHCELTGGFASWGYWHNKAAQNAVALINKQGGIANRKVELVTEDTESNPAAGARKLRNLIQRSNAEFVMGSVHSGIMLASIPIATELKTIYMSMGEATEATGSKGTRYSFRTGMDTYSIAAAGVPWCMENLGKNWTVVYADYAWGQSHYQETKAIVERLGGKIVGNIPVPLDAKDFVPYLTQIPPETQVVFSIFFGSLSVAFYTQSKSMGIGNKMKMYSVSGTLEAIAPADIEGAAEGVYILENFPRMLKYKDDAFHREHNKIMAIDDIDARESGSKRVMAKSHAWQSWEDMFALKGAIEASGYKTRKDTEGVIQALEGLQMKNSLGHPQGNKLLRKEDHSGILDCYISHIENGRLDVKKKVAKEDLAIHMPVRHNLSKMPA